MEMSESMDVDPPNSVDDVPDVRQDPPVAEDVIVLDDDEVCDLTTTKISTKCINYACKSGEDMLEPPVFCLSYYRVKTKVHRKQQVCAECYNEAVSHYDRLAQVVVAGFPLVDVPVPLRNDVFEIDDSDSDSDADEPIEPATMRVLSDCFDDTVSGVLERYNFEDQAVRYVQTLHRDYARLEQSFEQIKETFRGIRSESDEMIFELSNLMRPEIHELPAWDLTNEVVINKKVQNRNCGNQSLTNASPQRSAAVTPGTQQHNILKSTLTRPPLKQIQSPSPVQKSGAPISPAASSLSSGPDGNNIAHITGEVIVIPADLPPVGEVVKAPLKLGETYYANRSEMVGTWIKAVLTAFVAQGLYDPPKYEITIESKQRTIKRIVTGKELAYATPCGVQLKVGARVIAVFRESTTTGEIKKNKKDSFYPGIIAEPLQLANKYRYLIFFDDGYAQYVSHNHVHLIHESSKDVWEDINVNARAFVKKYLENYENRAMVRFLKDQTVRTEYNGKWWVATVINVDCSLVQVFFDDINRIEWIYRGTTRFAPMFEQEQAAANRQHKQRFSRKPNTSGPYVEFTRIDGTITSTECQQQQQQQRSVARKSTSKSIGGVPQNLNPFTPVQEQEPPATKIVYYTPRRQKPKTNCYNPHKCGPECRDFLFCPLGRMKGYSPLAKPLLCGFYRLLYKIKHKKFVVYRAPCGRTLRNMDEVHRYLNVTRSDLTVDLFDFNVFVRCLAEFMVESKSILVKDLSQGKEECPITVCNYVDSKQLDFCNYSTKRQPMEGVDLNLNPEFLVCCDCTDDCADKLKCACWQLTLQCLKYMEKGTDPRTVGYHYRRLPEPIFTGIYECNQRCKCKHSCLNRVVQNPMQHKLQVFKTDSRGWGIRSLNDIPQGSFICIYAGSLLTEEMANLDGKSYGDEYLAELDFIETAERTKEDYEDDPYHDELVKEEKRTDDGSDNEDAMDDEEDFVTFREKRDDHDFVPTIFVSKNKGIAGLAGTSEQPLDLETGIRSRLRKRNSDAKLQEKNNDKAERKQEGVTKQKVTDDIEDTVMISDDEDYAPREPSSFNPKDEVDDKEPRKYQSVREFFGSDEDVYIMDAKSTGNIGRFLNHSCSPNIFVQNVFVDTHDPRFPWVAFFTMCYVRAGTELTWNYNYDIGSVPGKVLYCYCGSSECKGRLL